MKILAIETSCDETALAVLEARGGLRAPKFDIVAEAISSQVKVHRPFGGGGAVFGQERTPEESAHITKKNVGNVKT
jgi:tRNA A37 threonylcarbamoyltransferase TsaD